MKNSTICLQNKVYIIGDKDTLQPFHYYDWAEFLSMYFKTVPQITSYHHFRFTKEKPNAVYVREFANSEEKCIIIVKDDATIDKAALPSILYPSGLSAEHQLYLFEHIATGIL